MDQQAPDTILMIRPVNFGYNPLTAASNVFQHEDSSIAPELIKSRGKMEFDLLTECIRASHIDLIVVEDRAEPITPDSIFPNNWASFHHDGSVFLYPMMAENRRLERREDILIMLQEKYGFNIKRIIDLSVFEQSDHFLEGTGSMVMDYINKFIYANLSPRTDEIVIDRFCEESGFHKVIFPAVDERGREIYHTNVLMCIGTGYVVVCLDAIPDESARMNVMRSFESTGHEIIDISLYQMSCFAGNMIEVNNKQGQKILIMSESAFRCLGSDQEKRLSQYCHILYSPLDIIEKYGGGSARCMIAGIFLPKM